jgi:hypothetical protein
MINKIEKIIKEMEVLSVQSFNDNRPAWISNSLTTIELKLKETLKQVKELYNEKNS